MVASATVAIAGGSLGGLTTGLLLRELGFDVTIYERSSVELEQRGAGIGFLPDSSRYLVERAGLAIDDISTATELIRYLNRDGSIQHDLPHEYRFSSWNTVYRNLLSCFGHDRYLLDHEVTQRSEHDGVVTFTCANGFTGDADLLVAADGIGSTFRQQLLPNAKRQYAGYVAWRGMVPESELDTETLALLSPAITYYVYANSHILVYPIPRHDGSIVPGERLINFVWYRNYNAGSDLNDLMTDAAGTGHEISLPPGGVRPDHIAEMRAHAEARLPRVVANAVTAVVQPFLQVVYDVEIDHMAFGRTCLVGDAGFVARPHAAAGTAKAAANAWALADALATHDTIPDALADWEKKQLALGRQLLERTRRVGARSQVTNTWDPVDPDNRFRLREEGP
ncbi:MAG: monooxygenase [Acidimicrobiia bacterium]